MDWTRLFGLHLEKILPVRHVVREPGIPLSFGNAYRNWRADYTFSLDGTPFVVEAKVHEHDTPLGGTKVLAYQKLYNIHTARNYSALIVSRKSNTNSADFLACSILKISLLIVDFKEQADKSMSFTAKLDGSVTYQASIANPQEASMTTNPIERTKRPVMKPLPYGYVGKASGN